MDNILYIQSMQKTKVTNDYNILEEKLVSACQAKYLLDLDFCLFIHIAFCWLIKK